MEYLTAEQAAAYLNLTGPNAKEALRNLIRRHRLPVLKPRGTRLQRFRKDQLDAWLANDKIQKAAR